MDINYPSGFSDLPTALVSHVGAFSMVKCRVAAAAAAGSFSILFLTTRGAVAPKEVIVISSITNDGLSSK
jgi:hypothetical protein